MAKRLLELTRKHKNGHPVGIHSVCSAQRFVLEAAMLQAKADNTCLLIEPTSNQVDQYGGGYTGLTPGGFVEYISAVARDVGYPWKRIILGGDHLGPNAWQTEAAVSAMGKAEGLIRAYVAAGFTKIHLDTSMRLADDGGGPEGLLAPEIVAERSARLCRVAEESRTGPKAPAPVYVIGSDVAVPGGAREDFPATRATTPDALAELIHLTRRAFAALDVETAWERVIAAVVQPGVEFGPWWVNPYDPDQAAGLARCIEGVPGMVLEAHSTDYQTPAALKRMVQDHFAILKVGPWLTFAFREAVFALAQIEAEWLGAKKWGELSGLREEIERAMLANPRYWSRHYHGTEAELALARRYSYSDRIRYYWHLPRVKVSLERLLNNLTLHPAPFPLLHQYLPVQAQAVHNGLIGASPLNLVRHKIMEVVRIYARACKDPGNEPGPRHL